MESGSKQLGNCAILFRYGELRTATYSLVVQRNSTLRGGGTAAGAAAGAAETTTKDPSGGKFEGGHQHQLTTAAAPADANATTMQLTNGANTTDDSPLQGWLYLRRFLKVREEDGSTLVKAQCTFVKHNYVQG